MSFIQRLKDATDTWLTPPEIVRALGEFDLDPCASPLPRPWDLARVNYQLPEYDGFKMPWTGRVWLNPPYGKETGKWISRMAAHGNGTALIFARTDTSYWHDVIFKKYAAIMFLRGRIKFHKNDGTKMEWNAPSPVAIIAFSDYDANILKLSGLNGRIIT